jgi:hypothetical protein
MENDTDYCCNINGVLTIPETATRNGTCYLIIFIFISLALIIVSIMNLIKHSDISLIVYGSLIQIMVNSIQILHKVIIICNRKSLLSSGCCIPCGTLINILFSMIVVGTSIGFSVMATLEEQDDRYQKQEEKTQLKKKV